MKNKILRNVILTVAVSSVIAVPIFVQNVNLPISEQDTKIVPINYIFKHWAEIYYDKLLVNSDVEEVFKDENLNDEGIIKSEVAKEIIEKTSEELINNLKDKNTEKISDYVHPVKGVRFTPYTTVSADNDLVLSKEDMINLFNDENSYIWGYYDGSGVEIKLTPSQYYEEFVYSEDFINASEVGYNKVLSSGNMVENQFDEYENAIVVEYYIPEINPEYEGIDWQSLRLVFERYEGNWMLVGIIHNQWTI